MSFGWSSAVKAINLIMVELYAALHNGTRPQHPSLTKFPSFPGSPRTSFGDYLDFVPIVMLL